MSSRILFLRQRSFRNLGQKERKEDRTLLDKEEEPREVTNPTLDEEKPKTDEVKRFTSKT